MRIQTSESHSRHKYRILNWDWIPPTFERILMGLFSSIPPSFSLSLTPLINPGLGRRLLLLQPIWITEEEGNYYRVKVSLNGETKLLGWERGKTKDFNFIPKIPLIPLMFHSSNFIWTITDRSIRINNNRHKVRVLCLFACRILPFDFSKDVNKFTS